MSQSSIQILVLNEEHIQKDGREASCYEIFHEIGEKPAVMRYFMSASMPVVLSVSLYVVKIHEFVRSEDPLINIYCSN